MINLPVIQDNSRYSSMDSQSAPCVKIFAGINSELEPVTALIDTGADFVYAEPSFLQKYNAPKLGVTDVNGEIGFSYHALMIKIPEFYKTLAFRVIAREMVDREYQFVLGRSFLQYCTFVYNGASLQHRLSFDPQSIPQNRMLL